MYFPIENDDIDCYMSVKSVFPNGVERSYPNIVNRSHSEFFHPIVHQLYHFEHYCYYMLVFHY